MTTYNATASNGTNEPITGNVTEGALNDQKYPRIFTITDDTHNKPDGNKYTFTFIKVNDKQQPIYQCTEFNGKTSANSIEGVQYTVTAGITKDTNGEYHISDTVLMDAIKGTGTQVIHKDEVENATETKTLTANNTTIK